MGANTAIMYMKDFPDSINSVVLDSGFSNLRRVMDSVLADTAFKMG